ncbi:Flp family type IVb pilin [Shimia ponticola]|uniref:Flp family type IVb pilin n=1 Tax=Shimia ponticola TaxID=2582893 RepID=UPI0011BE11BF|nr:hypothetical protein [Shimia ponticola]
MMNFLNKFRKDEDGAVTVDWVVLTAAIVGLGIAILATVTDGVEDLASEIDTELSAGDINALTFENYSG